MNSTNRNSLPSASTRLLSMPGPEDRVAPAALEASQPVSASDPPPKLRAKGELIAILLQPILRLAAGSPPALAVIQACAFGIAATGACLTWLATVLPRVIMWASIGLVLLVVGTYAAFRPRREIPHLYEIHPDPDFHPLPDPCPAPVGPLPADAEMIARAR